MKRFSQILLAFLIAVVIPLSAVAVCPAPVSADALDLFWVGAGTDWWDGTAGTKWATSTGGGGGHAVPTSTNNVFFDGASPDILGIAPGAACANLDTTGFTGSFTNAAGDVSVYGNLTMGVTQVNSIAAKATMKATTTGHTITMNGYSLPSLVINGVGGEWTLQDNLALTAPYTPWGLTVTNGSLITNNKTVTITGAFGTVNIDGGSITLGTSVVSLTTTWSCTGGTVSAASSTINFTALDFFIGGGKTYGTVYGLLTSTHGYPVITGANTYANLSLIGTSMVGGTYLTINADQVITGTFTATGYNSYNKRLTITSDNTTGREIRVTGAYNITNCNLAYIYAGGALIDWDISAGLNYDLGHNLHILFSTGGTMYWVGNTGSTSDINHWASTSGGPAASAPRLPTLLDSIIFDANSVLLPGRTITFDYSDFGTINASGIVNTPTFTGTVNCYGSFSVGAPCVWNSAVTLSNRLIPSTFNTASTLNGAIVIDTDGMMVTVANDSVIANSLTLTSGYLDFDDYSVTAQTFASSVTTYDRAIHLGSGVFTLNGVAAGTKWNVAATNFTVYPEESTILWTNSGANEQTFAGASLVYNNLTIAGAGAYTTTFTGTNSFGTLTVDRSEANKTIAGAVTITLTDTSGFMMSPSAARTITITNTDFSMAAGVVMGDYLEISGSSAGGGAVFYASTGGHSHDLGGNAGWLWVAPTAPTIATVAASNVTAMGQQLNGNLLTAGSYTVFYCYFEYGPTVAYGFTTTPEHTLVAAGTFDDYLSPYHTYHYRAVVRFGYNDHAYGADAQVSLAGAVGQAKAAVADPGAGVGVALVSAAPAAPGNMYTEGDTDGLFGLGAILDPALAAADIPKEVFWYPVAFFVAILLGFLAYGWTRTIIIQAVVSAVTMAAFAGGGALGDGLLPYWTVLVFIIEAAMIFVIQEKQNA